MFYVTLTIYDIQYSTKEINKQSITMAPTFTPAPTVPRTLADTNGPTNPPAMGKVESSSEQIVELYGTGLVIMDSEGVSIFQGVLQDFLDESLAETYPSINITSVFVKEQSLKSGAQDVRKLEEEATLYVKTHITGRCDQYPQIDINEAIANSINSDGEVVIWKLKNQSTYSNFQNIQRITTVSDSKGNTAEITPTDPSGTKAPFYANPMGYGIMGATGFVLFIIVACIIRYMCCSGPKVNNGSERRRRNKYATTNRHDDPRDDVDLNDLAMRFAELEFYSHNR